MKGMMDWWSWLKVKTAPTLFRVLPIDPSVVRDELLAKLRAGLFRHAFEGEYLTKQEAEHLVNLIDEYHARETCGRVRHPVRLSPDLLRGRSVDTSSPPCKR